MADHERYATPLREQEMIDIARIAATFKAAVDDLEEAVEQFEQALRASQNPEEARRNV